MDKFKYCLVGEITKGFMPYAKVVEAAHKAWDSMGLCGVAQKSSRKFLFKFQSDMDMNKVLSRGTWYFERKPMVLCAWGSTIGIDTIKTIPLWIKISNMPDYYWTCRGLSHIASAIGEPIGADTLTSQLKPLPFAKMCVSYKVGDPLPDKLNVATLDPVAEGKPFSEVSIAYLSKPLFCKGCNSLGHQASACPNVKRFWVEKGKIDVNGTGDGKENGSSESTPVKDDSSDEHSAPPVTETPVQNDAGQAPDPCNNAVKDTSKDANVVCSEAPPISSDEGWETVQSKKNKQGADPPVDAKPHLPIFNSLSRTFSKNKGKRTRRSGGRTPPSRKK